jgi:MtrB/PioB family decaheme-associated outer membrane protein
MKTSKPLLLLGALGALSAAAGDAAAVDTSQWKCESCPFEKESTTGTVEVGVGATSDESAKFGDYTGLNEKGAFAIVGGTVRHRGANGTFANAEATDLGIDGRSLTADAGREGVYGVRFGYAEIPRYFAEGARTPFLGLGSGTLTLPAGFPAATTGAMPLATTLYDADLGYKRTRYDLGGTFISGENWTYRVSLRHDVRDGTKPGAGSFFSSASHLALPVDEVTDQIEAAAAYFSRRFQATVAYYGSLFRNGEDSLTWANPFTPVVAGADRGQLALAPDNQFHQIMASAGYDITPKIRASGDIAFGRMTQDASYLPATLNSGLTVPTLPVQSLDGRADTFNASVRVTATPTDRVRLNASYARDVRDNKTSSQSYPSVTTDMFVGSGLRTNLPYSFWQDRFKVDAEYRGPHGLKAIVGADYDQIERSYQEVVRTRETTIWGRLGAQLHRTTRLELKLAHAQRNPSTYGIANWLESPQNPLLRKYNLAERTRDTVGLRADVAVSDEVTFGVNADYSNDDYSSSTIGLLDGRDTSVGADLSYALNHDARVYLYANSEEVRSRQAGSQAFAQADWWARTKDRINVVGAGIKHVLMKGKLELGGDISYSRSRSDIAMEPATSSASFPTARVDFESLKLYATYHLRENLSLIGSYWYEHYNADDWRLDGVQPDTVSNLLAFGNQAPNYTQNVVRVSLRYRF